MGDVYPKYIPIGLGRGQGKTTLALAWATRQIVQFRSARLVIADTQWASGLDQLVEPLAKALGAPWSRATGIIRLPRVPSDGEVRFMRPQADELTVKGLRFDAAVLDNVDNWPTVEDTWNPNKKPGPFSVLAEEIFAHTFGPILFTFTDRDRLPEPFRSVI
jgi:hypothetical protein